MHGGSKVNNRGTELQRFWKRVRVSTIRFHNGTPCWEWAGPLYGGYGRLTKSGGGSIQAHRWAYMNFVGPIAQGLEIDHLCRNEKCVNPEHLEAVPHGSKKNPTITKEVCDDKHADGDAGSWSDKLWPAKSCGKRNSFTALRKHLGAIRAFHYSRTFVFEDSLWRILPNKSIEAYKKVVEEDGKTTAFELLESFINDLPNLIALARIGRAEAFNEADYPTVEEVRAKFRYIVDYRPVPTSAGLNPALMQEAIDKLNALHAQRLAEANTTLVTRFLEPFKLLSEQLEDPAKRKMAPVLDSIREFSQIVPSLDLSGNTELVELAQQIAVTFQDITPEIIKADEEMAKFVGSTANSVVEALSRFGNIGVRKFAA